MLKGISTTSNTNLDLVSGILQVFIKPKKDDSRFLAKNISSGVSDFPLPQHFQQIRTHIKQQRNILGVAIDGRVVLTSDLEKIARIAKSSIRPTISVRQVYEDCGKEFSAEEFDPHCLKVYEKIVRNYLEAKVNNPETAQDFLENFSEFSAL